MSAPLIIPRDLPEFTRDYLAQLDAAVSETAAGISSISFREAASLAREMGMTRTAEERDATADRIDLDPRLYVAGCMHNHATDGTAKLMLHTYVGLVEAQAEAARKARRAA